MRGQAQHHSAARLQGTAAISFPHKPFLESQGEVERGGRVLRYAICMLVLCHMRGQEGQLLMPWGPPALPDSFLPF